MLDSGHQFSSVCVCVFASMAVCVPVGALEHQCFCGAKCRWRAGSDFLQCKNCCKLKMRIFCIVYGCSNGSN